MAYNFELNNILQAIQLAHYFHRDYRFSYLKTKDDAEIDLVVERPGLPLLFIEIKSNENVQSDHLKTLKQLSNDYGDCEAICFSRDIHTKKCDNITVYPWLVGLKRFFADN